MAVSCFAHTLIATGFNSVTVAMEDSSFCNSSKEGTQAHLTGEVLETSTTSEAKDMRNS